MKKTKLIIFIVLFLIVALFYLYGGLLISLPRSARN